MKIDKLLAELDGILDGGTEAIPQIKALDILRGYFEEYQIPIAYIGRIKLDIDDTFFDDEEKARQVLMKFALVVMRIYRHVQPYSTLTNSKDIFGDILSSMAITLHENGEG